MNDLTLIREWSRGDECVLQPEVSRAPPRLSPGLRMHWRFFAAFLRHPATMGALAPSSASLARAVLARCRLQTARTVVELGPGTGAITRFILERIGRNTTFLALELEAEVIGDLQNNFPRLKVYRDSAEHLQKYLALNRRKKADSIVSGLPWASMSTDTQDRILSAVIRGLRPGGSFSTFAYLHAAWLPPARRFRDRLKRHFATVQTSRIIWNNLPPAYVYYCC